MPQGSRWWARCRTSPGPAAGSPHEIGEGHVEDAGDQREVVDQCPVGALLDPIDRLTVQADPLGEAFLCEFLAHAFGSNVVPDGPALVEYPVGQGIGWHGYTLVKPEIDVCTIDGTFTEQVECASATEPRIRHPFE